MVHDLYSALFDGIMDAIEFGFNQYRQSAGLVDVQIQAAMAKGGRLQGPALDPLIARAPSVAGWVGWKAVMRDAAAKGMEQQWSALAASVTVPGLPWHRRRPTCRLLSWRFRTTRWPPRCKT